MCHARFLLAALLALAVPAADSAPAPRDEARCATVQNRIAELRLKLRLGYSAPQGRVYRQKLAALEAERRQVCR